MLCCKIQFRPFIEFLKSSQDWYLTTFDVLPKKTSYMYLVYVLQVSSPSDESKKKYCNIQILTFWWNSYFLAQNHAGIERKLVYSFPSNCFPRQPCCWALQSCFPVEKRKIVPFFGPSLLLRWAIFPVKPIRSGSINNDTFPWQPISWSVTLTELFVRAANISVIPWSTKESLLFMIK